MIELNTNFAEGEQTRNAAAVLRVVLALKCSPKLSLEDAMAGVIRDTGVDPSAFRGFIAQHMEVIARSVRTR